MNQPNFAKDQFHVGAHRAVREYLDSGFGWVTASTIELNVGVRSSTLRELCQLYPSIYVSSTEGYKLYTRATRRDIQHCVTTLLSRAEKMTSRAAALSGRLL